MSWFGRTVRGSPLLRRYGKWPEGRQNWQIERRISFSRSKSNGRCGKDVEVLKGTCKLSLKNKRKSKESHKERTTAVNEVKLKLSDQLFGDHLRGLAFADRLLERGRYLWCSLKLKTLPDHCFWPLLLELLELSTEELYRRSAPRTWANLRLDTKEFFGFD